MGSPIIQLFRCFLVFGSRTRSSFNGSPSVESLFLTLVMRLSHAPRFILSESYSNGPYSSISLAEASDRHVVFLACVLAIFIAFSTGFAQRLSTSATGYYLMRHI